MSLEMNFHSPIARAVSFHYQHLNNKINDTNRWNMKHFLVIYDALALLLLARCMLMQSNLNVVLTSRRHRSGNERKLIDFELVDECIFKWTEVNDCRDVSWHGVSKSVALKCVCWCTTMRLSHLRNSSRLSNVSQPSLDYVGQVSSFADTPNLLPRFDSFNSTKLVQLPSSGPSQVHHTNCFVCKCFN